MLIIEKGKSKTAPAETAKVKVLKNNLEEKRVMVTSDIYVKSMNTEATSKEHQLNFLIKKVLYKDIIKYR